MSTLGFNLQKGEIRYTLLAGTKSAPQLLERDRRTIVSGASPVLMDWFESTFDSIVDRTQPEKIAYRLALEPNKAQIQYLIFPYAILNLIAHRRKLEIFEYTCQNFVATKFGQRKNVDVYEYCTQIFGVHPPHWDRYQQYSVLAAWLTLGD